LTWFFLVELITCHVGSGQRWVQRDDQGITTVPWTTVNVNGPNVDQIEGAIRQIANDVECIRFPLISNSSQWHNGIVFVGNEDGCFHTDLESVSVGSIPATWHMISLDDGCDGYSTRVIHQLVMSTLGLIYEHQRPESHRFIAYSGDTVESNDPFMFDIGSVMLLDAYNGTAPRASTTDMLKLQYAYCEAYSTAVTHCGTLDELYMNRPIFKSRICDGFNDCPYGNDESGFLGECQVDRVGDCCRVYLVDDIEYEFTGYYLNDKPQYYSNTVEHYMIFIATNWFISTTTSTQNMYFLDKSKETSICPDKVSWEESIVICKPVNFRREVRLPSLNIETIYADVIDANGRVRYETTEEEPEVNQLSMGWMAFYLSMIFPLTWLVVFIVDRRKRKKAETPEISAANTAKQQQITLTANTLYYI